MAAVPVDDTPGFKLASGLASVMPGLRPLFATRRGLDETASFFNKSSATWEMVTKIEFRNQKIANISMFLD